MSAPAVDRSGEVGAPDGLPGMVPTACVIPGLRIYSITYCDGLVREPGDTPHHLHSLWRDREGRARWTDLTRNANFKVSNKEGIKNPFAYVDTTRNLEIVLWNNNFFPVAGSGIEGGGLEAGAARGDVWDHHHWRSESLIDAENLTETAGVKDKATAGADQQAVGYYNPADDSHHVFFVGSIGDDDFRADVHELSWTGISRVKYAGNLSESARPRGPSAAHLGSAFVGTQGYNFVLCRSWDNHIYSFYWKGNDRPGWDSLSRFAGTPPAQYYYWVRPLYCPDPVGYYTAHNDTHYVVYRGENDHLYLLFWTGEAPVQSWDLTERSIAPLAQYIVSNFSAYYSAGTDTHHVIYVTRDLRLHDISWTSGSQRPEHVDLTTRHNAPPARGRPASFAVDWDNTQHVAYRGNDNHIYELIW